MIEPQLRLAFADEKAMVLYSSDGAYLQKAILSSVRPGRNRCSEILSLHIPSFPRFLIS